MDLQLFLEYDDTSKVVLNVMRDRSLITGRVATKRKCMGAGGGGQLKLNPCKQDHEVDILAILNWGRCKMFRTRNFRIL